MANENVDESLKQESRTPSTIEELFALVDRPFIEKWLSLITDGVIQIGDEVDPQVVSFLCQMAVKACLEESSFSMGFEDSDGSFAMHLVATLWPTIPAGAKRWLPPDLWGALHHVYRAQADAAWHNLSVPGQQSAFLESVVNLYEKFPSLTANDRKALAEASPTLVALRRQADAQASCLKFLTYPFLIAFHDQQIHLHLGGDPQPDSEFQKLLQDPGMHGLLSALGGDDAYPILMAHRGTSSRPTHGSYDNAFDRIVQSPTCLPSWKEIQDKVRASQLDPSMFKEAVLNGLFLASYHAAFQLMNCQSYLQAAARRGPGIKADSSFRFTAVHDMPAAGELAFSLIMSVQRYYQITFPCLDRDQIRNLAHRNPIGIYMQLLRLAGTHAGKSSTPLDHGDDWGD